MLSIVCECTRRHPHCIYNDNRTQTKPHIYIILRATNLYIINKENATVRGDTMYEYEIYFRWIIARRVYFCSFIPCRIACLFRNKNIYKRITRERRTLA